MKLLNLSLVAAALSLSAQAVAYDKIDLTEPQTNTNTAPVNISRAAFLGLDNEYFVQTEAGVKQAKQLVKGQKVVTQSGQPLAELTGKLVVKLAADVSANEFAQAHGLKLDWQSNNNLVLFSAEEGVDLLTLVTILRASSQVERAKLDRAIDKQQVQ